MRIKKMQHKADIQKSALLTSQIEETKKKVSKHLMMGDTALELMKTCFTIGLREINDREIQIRTKVILDTINRDFDRLRKVLSPLFVMKTEYEDHMKGDHSYELYRLFCHFSFMATDHLSEFNNGCEEANKKALQEERQNAKDR